MPILLNEVRPELYNAHLLDFNAGTVGPEAKYFSSDVSLFFVRLSTRAVLRNISMKFEFVGANEFDTAKSISDFTSALMKDYADIKLPDGFCYHCMLTSTGSPARITETIYTADFTFLGYRHLPMKTIIPANNAYCYVDGNYETSCVLTFKNAASSSGEIVIANDDFSDVFSVGAFAATKITIDGMSKRAYDDKGNNVFGSLSMNSFPRLMQGKNRISFKSVTDLSISYLPIFV